MRGELLAAHATPGPRDPGQVPLPCGVGQEAASSPRPALALWPQSEPGPGPAEGRRGREGRGAQAGAPGRPWPHVAPGVQPVLRPAPPSPPGPSTPIGSHSRPCALWPRWSLDVGPALRRLLPSTVHPQLITPWPSLTSLLAVSTVFLRWHFILALLLVTDLWEGGLSGFLLVLLLCLSILLPWCSFYVQPCLQRPWLSYFSFGTLPRCFLSSSS